MAELWPNLKIILAELAVIFKKFGRILFQTVGNTGGMRVNEGVGADENDKNAL